MFGLSSIKLFGGLAALLLLAGLVADRSRWMHRAHNDEAQLTLDCAATRAASNLPKLDCKQVPQQIEFLHEALDAVRAKTAKAQADDAAHAHEVEGQQTTIGQESSRDYQAELARVRADYAERLRRSSAANSSGRGNAAVSGASSSASGPDAAAAQNGLPPEDALTATEQAVQLKAFQDWARKEGLANAQIPKTVVR